jgi:Translationally controlled tumour protein
MSDSFPITEIDGTVLKVKCHMINEAGVKVDIGANPSAEGSDDEAVEDQGRLVNDVLSSFRLEQTSFDKKSYMTYIKGYMKRLKEYLETKKPERVAPFQTAAAAFVKDILAKFDDYDFYVGESMDPEAMVVILGYEEDGISPFVYLFKDGLRETKMVTLLFSYQSAFMLL